MQKQDLQIIETTIRNALRALNAPGREADIVADGMLGGVHIDGRKVTAMLEVDPAQGPALESLRQDAERILRALPGVEAASVVLTAERAPPPAQAAPDPHGMGRNPILDSLSIRRIVAVASGKGGVGKSTIAAALAVALAQGGARAGLLDADIYGPSQPLMMGTGEAKPGNAGGRLQPVEAHGLKIMSMGMMVPPEAPMIWRGPMVQSAIYQMLRDVDWTREGGAPLDVLVVDMPPGTGDAQLTFAQKVPLASAVIVSTPQDVALIDARKAIEMFRKTGVEVLGLIENMSGFVCPCCGTRTEIFGSGGAQKAAGQMDVPFLGAIPIRPELPGICDSGDASRLLEGEMGSVMEKAATLIRSSPESQSRAPPAGRPWI